MEVSYKIFLLSINIFTFVEHIFVWQALHCIHLFRLPKLKEAISMQTRIAPADQMLFYSSVTLAKALKSTDDTIQQYPKTSEDNPIKLVGNHNSPAAEKLSCELRKCNFFSVKQKFSHCSLKSSLLAYPV